MLAELPVGFVDGVFVQIKGCLAASEDKALLEKAYELKEESRMEDENAQGGFGSFRNLTRSNG